MMNKCSCQYSVIWPICSDGAVQPYVVNKQCKFFLLLLGHCGNSPRNSSRHENIVHNKYILLFITRQPPYYKNGTGHNLQPGSINKFMGRFSFLSSSTPLRYKQKKRKITTLQNIHSRFVTKCQNGFFKDFWLNKTGKNGL